ncbi:MAG: hypothetical protein K2X01_08025 [Cyanobacteria bacterium]|nr:hypothetical protein [Cyanobacteriota bacterium]
MAMNWNVTNWAPNSYPQNYRSTWIAPPLPQTPGQAGPYFSMPSASIPYYPQQPVIQYIPVPVVPNSPVQPAVNNSTGNPLGKTASASPASVSIEPPSISNINPFTENMPEATPTKNPASKPVEIKQAETKQAEKSAPKMPQAYSDEFGQKLGALVTDLLKQHPEWEAELKRLDVDQYLISPDKMAQRLKDAVKQSRILRFALQHSKGNIIKAFPDNLEPMAKQFLDWLLEYRD